MVKVRLFCWWCCVCCIVLLTSCIIILRARHDHNKAAPCGMIKVFLNWIEMTALVVSDQSQLILWCMIVSLYVMRGGMISMSALVVWSEPADMVMHDCEPVRYARRNDINDGIGSLWSEPAGGVVCVSSCALLRRSSSPPWYRPSWSAAQRRRLSFWGSCMISSSRPLRVSLAVTSISVATRTNDSGDCDVLLSFYKFKKKYFM